MSDEVKQQMEFTDTEGAAICEMIARVLKEGYLVRIGLSWARKGEDDSGELYKPYIIQVYNQEKTPIVAFGQSFLLIEAMEMAYMATPELGAEDTAAEGGGDGE